MTQILGTIKDSSGLLSGKLVVKLSAPLVDSATSPDTVYLPIAQTFTITNGAVNITLQESETAGISYEFTFNTTANTFHYYRVDGTQYFGPTHQHTDTYYYTGSYHDVSSVRLDRQTVEVLTPVDSFVTIVPNIATCEYSDLLPTNFSRDRLSSGARQIANLIAFDTDYQAVLGEAIFAYMGDYNPTTWYKNRQWVSYAGSSWYSKFPNPQQGNTPATGSAYWGLLASKGDPGGTGGQDTAYNATGWDGATWAPTANVIRDIIEQLARASNAALTGNPTCPTQAVATVNTTIANTQYVNDRISNRLTNAALTGIPTTPTPALTDSSTTVASTAFVKNATNRYCRIIDSKPSTTTGGASIVGAQVRALNTIANNSGDIVNLASNQFTLRPGSYYLEAFAPAFKVDRHRLFLWNADAGSLVLNGAGAQSSNADNCQTLAILKGTFTIAVNTDFEIRHYTGVVVAGSGLGVATSDGNNEVYTQVEIWRTD